MNQYEGEKLKVNGIYDQLSFEAVRRFQKKYEKDILVPWKISVPTGYVYQTTLKKINEIYCQGKPIETKKTIQCPYFTKSLKLGLIDEEVKRVQHFLIDQGFLPKDFKPSSLFSKTTEEAVKKFQVKYFNEILKPWNLSSPTGYWHLTTRKQANKLIGCE